MRTKASIRAATSGAIFAAIFATFAIGGSGPAFAGACGVYSGSPSTGVVHVSTGTVNTHSGPTGSTHGTSSSSCPSMTNATKLNGSLGAGSTMPHFYAHTATGGTPHYNFQANNNHNSHTFMTNNKTFVKKP